LAADPAALWDEENAPPPDDNNDSVDVTDENDDDDVDELDIVDLGDEVDDTGLTDVELIDGDDQDQVDDDVTDQPTTKPVIDLENPINQGQLTIEPTEEGSNAGLIIIIIVGLIIIGISGFLTWRFLKNKGSKEDTNSVINTKDKSGDQSSKSLEADQEKGKELKLIQPPVIMMNNPDQADDDQIDDDQDGDD